MNTPKITTQMKVIIVVANITQDDIMPTTTTKVPIYSLRR